MAPLPSSRVVFALLLLVASCGWPSRFASRGRTQTEMLPISGFEDVRAVDGYPDAAFQASFDRAAEQFAASPAGPDGRRAWNMLVLSSGGVNGSFGAGILTAWTRRGDRPDFQIVTGVSVGALMAPFVFAGPRFDDRLEALFRRIEPSDLHREKGVLTSVLWDESLADNAPLKALVARGVDEELMEAIATQHEGGRRCWVGSTNLDIGRFCVWDLGAIASRRTPRALQLLRDVLVASASIPVVYPPMRFEIDSKDELHADGAITRPLFLPQGIFDCHLAAERAGVDWRKVDSTMYVIHNGSLRPSPANVQRDTLAIATRTVTMMSYTMVTEHVLHLYLLSRVYQADFRFHTLPDGLDLSIDAFDAEDTNRLFLLGQGMMERKQPWLSVPPGYVVSSELASIEVVDEPASPAYSAAGAAEPVVGAAGAADPGVDVRLSGIEAQLRELRRELRTLRRE